MAVQVNKKYVLGDFLLEPDKRTLSRADTQIHLAHRPFQVLLYLIEHRDRVVSRRELLEGFWGGHEVYEEALSKCIGAIRKALDDHLENPRHIETRWAEGYRYIGRVEEQFLRPEPSLVEIEKTRGVKIIIEEESAANGVSGSEEIITVEQPAEPLRLPAPRRSARGVAMTLVLGAAALAIGVLFFYLPRTRPGPQAEQPAPIRSLAVLPLRNLPDDPANEYFSDGVTESLLTSLSKIDGLKVISRGSVYRFKGQEVDPREVGKQLNVAAVLEGSVRRDENSVRVAVRLVSAEDGRVLWASETYERTLRDIFALQDEIARQVTTGLRFKLSGENAQQLTRRYTDNVEAYQLYLKGRFFWNKRTQEGLRKGIEYFEQAIKLDPSYALAYAGLADSYNVMGSLGLIKPQEEYAKVEAAACKALEIDETLSEAHTALAWVRFQQWDWTGAEAEFKRAIELNPNYATAHQWYAEYLTAMARFDEALAEIGRAQQIDPTSLVINTIVAQTYLNARQYDEAIEQCHKTLELDPSFELAYIYLGNAYIEKGMYEEALAEYQKAKQLEGTPAMLALTGITYARSGNREGARRALHELMAVSKQKYDPSFNIARIYANLGDRDEAFKWLEKLFDERSGALIFLKVDPQLDKLRTDPRFTDLVRRVGLTP